MASLRLEARPQTLEEVGAGKPQNHAFRILLSVSKEPVDVSATPQWEDIEIIPSFESLAAVERTKRNPDSAP